MDAVQDARDRAEHRENARNLRIAVTAVALLIGGRIVSAAYSNDPSPGDSNAAIVSWAGRAMMLGLIGVLLELFMWTDTPWRRRTAVWTTALVAGTLSATAAHFAPPPSGPFARYGLSIDGIASIIALFAFSLVIVFPVGWLAIAADERRKKELVQFPSRGRRIPRNPGA